MLLKKVMLEKLIEEGKVKSFSIAGKATKEMQKAYMARRGFTDIFKTYDIDSRLNEYESGLINVYFPDYYDYDKKKKIVLIETCIISFRLKDSEGLTLENAIDEMNKIIDNLLVEVYDYYQADLNPVIFKKVLGIDDGWGKHLTFEDMLRLIPEKQNGLSEKLGVNKGTVSDYKADRINPSLSVISKLINLYPLLPWTEYIQGLSNEEDKQ